MLSTYHHLELGAFEGEHLHDDVRQALLHGAREEQRVELLLDEQRVHHRMPVLVVPARRRHVLRFATVPRRVISQPVCFQEVGQGKYTRLPSSGGWPAKSQWPLHPKSSPGKETGGDIRVGAYTYVAGTLDVYGTGGACTRAPARGRLTNGSHGTGAGVHTNFRLARSS